MQTRSAPELSLSIGLIAGEVCFTSDSGATPPEWIKVTPRGPTKTRDGRNYIFDPEALVARFKADGIDLPVDTDHSTALRATRGEAPNTIGHVTALEARPDGTYARVSWLDGGKAVLAARTHRYVSPTIHTDTAGNVTWLHSVALVSAPALSMPALAQTLAGHAHMTPLENPMKQIAKALGLADDANEAACLAVLNGRIEVKPLATALGLAETADAAACLGAIGTMRQGSTTALTETQATLAATTARLAAVEKANRDKDLNDTIEAALKDRKIVPAQRDTYAQMASTDDGLKNVKALLAVTPPGLQGSGLDARAVETGDAHQDPATLAAEAQKLMAERAAIGQPIGIADAMTVITTRKKA